MTTPIIGIIVSGAVIVTLTLLFRFEENKGRRILEPVRASFDRTAVRLEQVSSSFSRVASGDLIRQSFHFFFHTLLSAMLRFLKRCEAFVDRMLRSNRTHAKKVRKERLSRNKLDEIAEHKESMTLSEEERKKRRDESLNG